MMVTADAQDRPRPLNFSDRTPDFGQAARPACGRDVDGKPVTGVDNLIRLLNAERVGRNAAFDVLRRGRLRRFDVSRWSERP